MERGTRAADVAASVFEEKIDVLERELEDAKSLSEVRRREVAARKVLRALTKNQIRLREQQNTEKRAQIQQKLQREQVRAAQLEERIAQLSCEVEERLKESGALSRALEASRAEAKASTVRADSVRDAVKAFDEKLDTKMQEHKRLQSILSLEQARAERAENSLRDQIERLESLQSTHEKTQVLLRKTESRAQKIFRESERAESARQHDISVVKRRSLARISLLQCTITSLRSEMFAHLEEHVEVLKSCNVKRERAMEEQASERARSLDAKLKDALRQGRSLRDTLTSSSKALQKIELEAAAAKASAHLCDRAAKLLGQRLRVARIESGAKNVQLSEGAHARGLCQAELATAKLEQGFLREQLAGLRAEKSAQEQERKQIATELQVAINEAAEARARGDSADSELARVREERESFRSAMGDIKAEHEVRIYVAMFPCLRRRDWVLEYCCGFNSHTPQ